MSLAILFHFLCAQHVSELIYPSSGACGYSVEASFSLQHGYHSNQTTPKLQHTSNQEQYDQRGNSTE